MSKNYIKIWAFVLILLLYGSFLLFKVKLPLADDMARHVVNGELVMQGDFDVLFENVYSYSEPGHPFVNHHWLSGVIFYLLFSVVGWEGLVILKTITYLLTFAIIFKLAMKKADFWLVSLLSIPTIIILIERVSLRPEMFSYLFIAIFTYLLVEFGENPKSNKIYWLVPIQLLWTNIHIFKTIGIMLVLAFLAEKLFMDFKKLKNNPSLNKLAIVSFLVILVTFINPHGVKGVFYRYPPDFPIKIAENQNIFQYRQVSSPLEDKSVVLFVPAVIFMLISMYIGIKDKRLSLFYLLGGIATGALGFVILRGLYFFGLFFLIVTAHSLGGRFENIKTSIDKNFGTYARKIKLVGVFLIFVLLIYLCLPSTVKSISPFIQRGVGLSPRATESAEFFRKNNLHGPIFNDPDSGSYLIYNFFPEEKVFTDNLFADAYSADFFNEYLSMVADPESWRRGLERYDFNVIFFYQYNAGENVRKFLYDRIQDPEWALVYSDPFNFIFVRNIPEFQNVIRDHRITPQNISDRLRYLAESLDFDDQVAFADTANIIGRTDIGSEAFLKILQRWPEKAKMWMIIGEWELSNDNPKSPMLSAMYLEKAISLGQKTAEAYAFLGAAYSKAGQKDKAIEALRKAVDINPNREDARALLESLERFGN